MKLYMSLLLSLIFISSSALAKNYIEPRVAHGAEVFNARCTMCHGNVGMGDGLLPRLVENYPNTSLRKSRLGTDSHSIREAIIFGGERGVLSELMPPFGDELTWLEIESLVMFLSLFHEDSEKALTHLSTARQTKSTLANREKGRALYKGRCILCHGPEGDGKGKMAKIIKNPPPFDFRVSRSPDQYLLQIISKGGEAMGRSPKMPIFGEELGEQDIRNLIAYIKGFRE